MLAKKDNLCNSNFMGGVMYGGIHYIYNLYKQGQKDSPVYQSSDFRQSIIITLLVIHDVLVILILPLYFHLIHSSMRR